VPYPAKKLAPLPESSSPNNYMKSQTYLKLLVNTAIATLAFLASSQAQTVVYENLGTGATAGYSELNSSLPIFGDALNLTAAGQLGIVGFSLYNSTSGGNTGSITNGTMTLKFYNNTVAYGGGALGASQPLLASVNVNLSFSGGLAPGFFTTVTADLTSLNIALTPNIFVTQQFTETVGNSLRNGIVLFGDPTIGSSPANVYINSAATPEGLYTFANNPSQFGYHIEITTVPEPTSLALAGIGAAGLLIFRRRK
jgi:hypothetical protein